MTDTIEPPSGPNSPPIASLPENLLNGIILFNAQENNELKIPIQIRDEDTDETLKVRWLIDYTGRPVTNPPLRDYPCPEVAGRNEIVSNNSLYREPFILTIENSKFGRGRCSRVDVAVSASFKDCNSFPGWVFKVTDTQNADDDLGLVTFWVWEVSSGPVLNEAAALMLNRTCPTTPYASPPMSQGTVRTAEM